METVKTMKTFDAQKARNVLERVNKFLGILIRENLVKDAPFLDEGELENESDLADDVWEILQMKPRNCDVGTAVELERRFGEYCDSNYNLNDKEDCQSCPLFKHRTNCEFAWAQMPYEEGTSDGSKQQTARSAGKNKEHS